MCYLTAVFLRVFREFVAIGHPTTVFVVMSNYTYTGCYRYTSRDKNHQYAYKHLVFSFALTHVEVLLIRISTMIDKKRE